ncbi:hypothetical protein AB0392_19780 [Nonomuraea angiospora]|uniref:hypothetical protein n=1 Tax=Nonomuraea angiospora TaxID=46172 RepID=UPI00344F3A20
MHLIANTVVALCSDPAQLAFARAKNAWEQVVEEALRSRGSVLSVMFRYPLRDVRLGEVTVGAGRPIMVGLCSAGTDRDRFGGEAGRFDTMRELAAHLGFGAEGPVTLPVLLR